MEDLILKVRYLEAFISFNKNIGYTIKKGSELRIKYPKYHSISIQERIEKLEKIGIIKDNKFEEDFTVRSSSLAVSILFKDNKNGLKYLDKLNGESIKKNIEELKGYIVE